MFFVNVVVFAKGGDMMESKWMVLLFGGEIDIVISSEIVALTRKVGKVRMKVSPSANWEQPA